MAASKSKMETAMTAGESCCVHEHAAAAVKAEAKVAIREKEVGIFISTPGKPR
jgi:hypothetical protein